MILSKWGGTDYTSVVFQLHNNSWEQRKEANDPSVFMFIEQKWIESLILLT